MKRQIVYYGALPQDTDLLNVSRNAYIGLAKLAAAILGTNTIFHNLAATPGSGLTVSIGPGQVYSLQNIDNAAYGSVAADTAHQILKQGVNLDSTVLNVPAPGTAGQSINYLIQAQFQEVDGGATVLPFYNSANPQVALSGPGNNGQASNTIRDNIVALQVKAGTAAATGSQTTPAADSGWTGLYVVTVANGQTSISAGNISTVAGAPFLTNNLYNFSNGLTVGGRTQLNGVPFDDGTSGVQTLGTVKFWADAYGYVSLTPSGGNGGEALLSFAVRSPRNGGDLRIDVSGQNGQGGNLKFSTSGVEKMRMTSGGRLLIGTSTDNGTDALQVAGSLNLSGARPIKLDPATANISLYGSASGASAIGTLLLNNNGSAINGMMGGYSSSVAFRYLYMAVDPTTTAYASAQPWVGGGVFVYPSGRVAITSSGGAGADNGSDALQVNGTSYISGMVTLGAGSWHNPAAGTGAVLGHATGGIVLAGNGTVDDLTINNKNGVNILVTPTGTQRILLAGAADNGTDALQVAGSIISTGKLWASAPGATNASGYGNTNQLSAPVGTVALFIGNGNDTSGLTASQYSNAIRFNGAGCYWGDISYYPKAALSGGGPAFKFTAAGAAVESGTSASVGMGTLYSTKVLVNGATDNGTDALQVAGSGKFTSTVSIANATANGHAVAAGQIQTNNLTYAVDTGVANAYAVAYVPAITALTDGMVLEFNAKIANTGASTLAVNGLTATSIVGASHQALQGGEIIANSKCLVIYSAQLSAFILLESTGGAVPVGAGTQTNHAVNLGQFTNSKATSGYQKLPNGLIIQWGVNTNGTSGSIPVTFPIAFPNGILCPMASYNGTTTGITISVSNPTVNGMTVTTNSSTANTCYWYAIGY